MSHNVVNVPIFSGTPYKPLIKAGHKSNQAAQKPVIFAGNLNMMPTEATDFKVK